MAGWLERLRLAWNRFGAARTLGLALGGGGVRGLAHIGVLTVLDREAIPIHSVAGTSMGAIVGAAYALSADFDSARLTRQVIDLGIKPPISLHTSGADREGLLDRLHRFIDAERFLVDTAWGWGAYDGTRVADALATLTAGKLLEEAKVPLAVVATDLLSGEKVVFRKGSAALALQASSALPGFFPPIKYQNRLLADGAFVDLVPCDVTRRMGAGIVVAVDVDQERTPVQVTNGLQAFLRAVDISARHYKRHHLKAADLVIRPEFGEPVHSLDFSKAELCVDAGVRAAERALPELRRLLRR